ncbi:PadR family transcriptional regulator [Calidifontibacillus erzurumensis]|uniref:Helix-turn-helix transcriptional regulator n=1 Tax=Calidifontibacillus erzurumensis TaxID=2741433 RepID=A0A8J8K9F8_9BACI|nr:PadR family transcriptional regulator [Calidifontibacillus erzurumensis]NSL53106.1 helix-turn-helix transcriptional regulator [Calidifontibacillus erzurumensis]
MNTSISTDLIRGHTDTILLNILRQGESYGYEIYKKIIELSNNKYELKEATLYTAFRRLEKEGYIISFWGDETQGGRRKYYRITEAGMERYEQNKKDWEFAKEILDQLIKGGINDGK